MAAVESALVPVLPDDTIDTIVTKVRSTGATSVELLVPDGTPALQALGGFERLCRTLERDNIGLLVISSDEKTLNAEPGVVLDTLGIDGARVAPPAPHAGGAADRFATRVLPAADRGRAAPIPDRDTAFLDALDQVPVKDRYADLEDDDADLYAALDDLSDTIQQSGPSGRQASSADDEFAAALDDWSDMDDVGRAPRDTGAAPRPRVSAADIDLSDDDLNRQRGGRRTESQRARTTRSMEAAGGTTARRRAPAGRVRDLEEDEYEPIPRRSPLARWLPIILIALIAVAALLFYLLNRTTITIAPPSGAISAHPFTNEVIPYAPDAAKPGAVQALPTTAQAEFTVQGQVISETLTPTGYAKGVVSIVNTIESQVPLPKGAEFIGANASGQEVRFTLDADAVVPPAVTTSSLSGRNTTYGQIDVGVTARSPGSASNVGENAIKQIVLPGQAPIATDTGNFVLRNAPIGGGNEQPVRVVTEADVQRKLQEALTGLYSAGIDKLQSQIDAGAQEIDRISITPDADALSRPEGYEITVEPAVGAQLPADNPNFVVTVRTSFEALATPRGQLVSAQLETALREHFQSPCKPGESARIDASDYRWDGQRLTVDGTLTCAPSGGLAPEAISRVKRAVGGKSRAEAEQSLKALQQEGLIGDYTLPPGRDTFPSLDFLLTVQEAQPAQPRPTPTP